MTETVRSLWNEPRAPDPPGPAVRDWLLVAVASASAVVETAVRTDLEWRAISLVVVLVLAWTIPWRRTFPLLMVVVAFGGVSTVTAVGLARGVDWEGLDTGVFLVLLLYALTRWGSGREVAAGLGVVIVPITLTAVGGAPVGDVIGGAVFVSLIMAIGVGVRYQQRSRDQLLDSMRSEEREQLARELHDTVAHHVSAIVIRAQAGRTLAPTQPDAAVEALLVIEEEAARTLEEMRTMVGALRTGDAELSPARGLNDIEQLARSTGDSPHVEVVLSGNLDSIRPSVGSALYRIAQEAVTNSVRHARRATLVQVRVDGGRECVSLTVVDDGAGGSATGSASGFGLVGMAERARLLGGTVDAGPRPGGGWTVTAELPRHGTTQ